MALAEDAHAAQDSTSVAGSAASAASLASVVVSLCNYVDRITEALQSVRAQTQQCLELIVVDDASTDNGTSVVERWIDTCLSAVGHPFVRVLLLRHAHNVGLATARNTALAHSQARWCFVLDADNALYPDAVAGCLALIDSSDPQLAVVILLAVEAVGSFDENVFGAIQSWQRERLRFENHVDAMALVPWEAVGGYTHIEGGWEDYDFWARGRLLWAPMSRILAVYRSHAASMSHCTLTFGTCSRCNNATHGSVAACAGGDV